MIRTHSVYIIEKNGGAPIQREVIFPEELEREIREYQVELTLCRETFREEAKKFRKQGCLVDAEINLARAERIDGLLKRNQPSGLGSSPDALFIDISSDQIDLPEPGMGGEKA